MLFDVEEDDLASTEMRSDPGRGIRDRNGALVILRPTLAVRGERLARQPSRDVNVLFTWLREVDVKRVCLKMSKGKSMLNNSLLQHFLLTEHVGSNSFRLVGVRERANTSGDLNDGLRYGDCRRRGCRRGCC